MNFIILLIALIIARPVYAEAIIQSNPEQLGQEILSDYAESQKWCDTRPNHPEKGQIIVFWSRDKEGRCILMNFMNRDEDGKLHVFKDIKTGE